MSNSSANAELVIRIKDATGPGSAAVVRTAEATAKASATAFEQASQRAAQAAERSASRQRSSYERLSQARETLGMRSEHAVQREIQRTEAAYNRLATAGFRSATEQAAAYERTRQKVTQLTNEIGKLTTAQRRAADEAAAIERGQKAMRIGASALVGTGAAAYTLRDPARQAMSFDERLANMANTAFAERDTAGRRVGMKELETAVNKAVGKGGGGMREQAAETLDAMVASGAMSPDAAIKMLPTIMRHSSASGADPAALANIGIRAMQTFKIAPEDMPNVLNMAIAGGQAGGFELKDMARWLPQQMAAATASGMSGRSGFAKLTALNQAAAITAGTKDEAGNNVLNLLAKINSSDTAQDAKKLGIDLPKYLQERRSKGVDAVDAFGELVDKTVAGRDDYKALQKRLAGAKDDGTKKEVLESMATIAQGAGMGKLIQDRQAMMALLGVMNNKAYMADVLSKVQANDVSTGGAGDKNYALMSETSAFLARQASQNKEAGEKAVMDSLTPAIGATAEAFGDLAQKYPLLVGATTLATGAMVAFATTAGMTSLMMGGKVPGAAWLGRVFGGGAGAAGLGTGTTVGAGAAGGFGATSAPVVGAAETLGATAGRASFALAPLVAMYGMTKWAEDTSKDKERVDSRQAAGDALNTVLGWFGYDKNGEIEARRAANRAELGGEEAKPAEVNATLTVSLAPGLVLTNQTMQASGGGKVQMNTGNINGVPG